MQYLVLTGFGGCINVLVYHLWIKVTDTRTLNLFVAVAAGSAVALYSIMRYRNLPYSASSRESVRSRTMSERPEVLPEARA